MADDDFTMSMFLNQDQLERERHQRSMACPKCSRTDVEYALHPWTCNDPWHANTTHHQREMMMTHSGGKPHNVGDKGQQYEVRAIGYPTAGVNIIGWSKTIDGAKRRMEAILLAPRCTSAYVFDRLLNATVFTKEADSR